MPDPFRLSSVDEMGERTDNQYLLAIAIAKRVRKLRSGAPALVEAEDPRRKPVRTAMREFAEGSIAYSLDNEEKQS